MPEKVQPLGICDHCLGPIPKGKWYTSKGEPRLHCSLDCKNTANSRAGSHIRRQKMAERIAEGLWQNPAELHKPDPANIGAAARRVRLAEVAEGRWRNPALTDEARRKLSRPRKHSGALASAIERLRYSRMSDLSDEERRAYQEYRRSLRLARLDQVRAWYRQWYRQRQEALSPEERKSQLERWRAAYRRRSRK